MAGGFLVTLLQVEVEVAMLFWCCFSLMMILLFDDRLMLFAIANVDAVFLAFMQLC
jgi:hypothetical protein